MPQLHLLPGFKQLTNAKFELRRASWTLKKHKHSLSLSPFHSSLFSSHTYRSKRQLREEFLKDIPKCFCCWWPLIVAVNSYRNSVSASCLYTIQTTYMLISNLCSSFLFLLYLFKDTNLWRIFSFFSSCERFAFLPSSSSDLLSPSSSIIISIRFYRFFPFFLLLMHNTSKDKSVVETSVPVLLIHTWI